MRTPATRTKTQTLIMAGGVSLLALVGICLVAWGATRATHSRHTASPPAQTQTPPVTVSPLVLQQASSTSAPASGANGASSPAASPAMAFDAKSAMACIDQIAAAIGPRVAGSQAERRARDYVVNRLTKEGYSPHVQPVPIWQGGTSGNIIAERAGGNRVIIIGAHLDSVAVAPGANDNASGVAVALELSRRFAHATLPYTLRFVVFGAEEGQYRGGHSVAGTGRHGSGYYVDSLGPAERKRVAVMINMDMVGAGPELDLGDRSENGQAPALKSLEIAQSLGYAARFDKFGGKSDYAPFHEAGMPILAVAWGDDPSHHTPQDKPSIVDPNKMKEVYDILGRYLETYS